ncbi:MAG: NAD(P)/FAD-dependent oxidoreductase [Sandaracinaceae bacterium]
MHTVVVGGGIAGLSLAYALARRGRRVTVLDAEPTLGSHSSARNAQIWLPTDDDETTGPLARATAEAMTALLGREDAWLARGDAIGLAPDEASAEAHVRGGAAGGVIVTIVDAATARRRCPALAHVSDVPVLVEGAGVLDPHAMLTALIRGCRDRDVRLRTSAEAIAIEPRGPAWRVSLADGPLDCDEVVIASGATAGALGRSIGIDVPMIALRRHLAILDVPSREAGTTVWRFADPPVYWRPDSGGALVSPCDEDPFDPGPTNRLPHVDPELAERLVAALGPIVPAWIDAPMRTAWACLRTYAHDRELVLGPDPRAPGLSWFAGFGGRGMTVAVGAAELCARAMDGDVDALASAMRPERAQPDELASA